MGDKNVLVIGGANGLGKEIVFALSDLEYDVIIADLERPKFVGNQYIYCDIRKFESVLQLADHLPSLYGIINCASINKIGWIDTDEVDNLSPTEFKQVTETNIYGHYYIIRELLDHLKQGKEDHGISFYCGIVSNASHIPMTASLAYNMSKAAQDIMIKQLARELTNSTGIVFFGVSPNKLFGTKMSQYIDEMVPIVRGWTPEYAQQYQRNSLMLQQETDPTSVANFVSGIIKDPRQLRYVSGCVFPFGA